MSASLVISLAMQARGHTKLSASRLLEPRYMIPAVVGGGAGAYWLSHKIKNDWAPTQGQKIENFIREHPVAVGAGVGGLAVGGIGALALRKLLKRLEQPQPAQEESVRTPPISIQLGGMELPAGLVQEEPKLAHEKLAGPFVNLLRAYGQAGRAVAGMGGRAAKGVAVGTGKGLGWLGRQGRKYTGMGQVEAEHAVRNAILKDKQLKADYELLTQHMTQRGIKPRTGLGGVLLNPGGAIGRHFSAAGRVGWDMEQLANPKTVQALLHNADPAVQQAVKRLQGMQMGGSPVAKYLERESGQGWLIPAVFAGSMAAPLVMSEDREARIAEPNTPGAKPGMLQPAANAVGGWVGQNISPTVGNWIQNNPNLSAGIAGAGAGLAGLAGYQALKG